MHKAQRLINHVALVLDGSSSMGMHKANLIKVADEQIRHLAIKSEEMSQETRVSVYLFNDRVDCLIFDMDVMRLPSIADLYSSRGMTALVDATIKSQDDLKTTSQIYGDHAFLTFVLTDGMENASNNSWTKIAGYVDGDENWTVGFLVPDRQGQTYMGRIGVPEGAVALWDAQSAAGLADSFSTIRTATDNFMTQRATGVRGTRSVFSTGKDAVNRKTVKANLAPLDRADYSLHSVNAKMRIDNFVTRVVGRTYNIGMGYYQLTKRETIQAQKKIIVVDKTNGQAYGGNDARGIIGLPNGSPARVSPDANPKYDIFVQSTSINRNLMPGTKLLVTKYQIR